MRTLDEGLLSALGFPESRLPALAAAIGSCVERPDPFVHDHNGVTCNNVAAIRIAPVQWLLPLKAAAAKLENDARAWSSAVPVPAEIAGLDDDAFAMLDAVACTMRHSASPTHNVGVLQLPTGFVSVAWAVDANAPCTEATRDWLRGKYMLDAPLYRAVQSVPWLDDSKVWLSASEREAAVRLVDDARHGSQVAGCTHQPAASAQTPRAPPPPTSASGRQVFLAWLAQQGGSSSSSSGGGGGGGGSSAAGAINGAAPPSSLLALAAACGASGPSATGGEHTTAPPPPPERVFTERPWRVYSDLPQVHAHLTRSEFVLVPTREESEVWFVGEHIRAFGDLADSPAHADAGDAGTHEGCALPLLNQFPHESVVISKNLFAEAAQHAYGRALPWLADTYTLPHQLPDLVCRWPPKPCPQQPCLPSFIETSYPSKVEYDAARAAGALVAVPAAGDSPAAGQAHAPTFIVKPWNLSRSRGVLIVRELAAVLALSNEALGPRLACAYVERPLLLDARKFDCRMYVGVRSLFPPRVHLYKHWYARVSATAYQGAPLEDHTAHLTVLKYMGVPQEFVGDAALLARLAAAGEAGDGPCFDWLGTVRPRLLAALAKAFRLLVDRAEKGSAWGQGRCRALYGIDIMFATSRQWQCPNGDGTGTGRGACDVQPVLLEVNYSPDMHKMVDERSNFVDEAFAHLFLGEGDGEGDDALWQKVPVAES